MTTRDERLHNVYSAQNRESLESEYDVWAANYDADLFAMGYVYPGLMAAMVARHIAERDAAVLDIGAGTGLVAKFLAPLGYTNLTALDMSEGMLEVARKSGCYRHCQRDVLGEPLGYADATFDAGISAGTFTAQHAPADCFEEILRVIKPGGLLILSLRVDSGVSAAYQDSLAALESSGRIALMDRSEETIAFLLADDPEEAKVRGRIFAYRLTG